MNDDEIYDLILFSFQSSTKAKSICLQDSQLDFARTKGCHYRILNIALQNSRLLVIALPQNAL